jgi:2-polyprenyl-3-methyl-5-hydroxy-6-metoxy-1,4-benzoquinol methylase/glycosyltransferase involved in cell wall biosynthesis/GT2 family glycosyltransferase
MKIAFLDTLGLKYDGNTLETKGIGGSESAVIYMSQELTKLGFNVTVFNKCDTEGEYNSVRYIDYSNIGNIDEIFDILVVLRTPLPYAPIEKREDIIKNHDGYDIQPLKPLIEKSDYKVLWMHDNFVKGEEWLETLLVDGHYDELFTLSDWQTQYVPNAHHGQELRHFEVMKRKIFQTRNGIKNFHEGQIDLGRYLDKEGNKMSIKDKELFVYNASTTKGMVPLLDTIWPKINEEFPNAKLYVIGGYYPSNDPNKKIDKVEQIWLNKKKEHNGVRNVKFTGIITQKEIAKILTKASYFIYPGAFPETFGISVLEALNYNVPVITTRFGALEENAPEATSYLIDYPITMGLKNFNTEGSVADKQQVEKFLDVVRLAYTNEYLRQSKIYAANEFKEFIGWDTVALQWKRHFYYKFGMFMPLDEFKEHTYRTQRLHQLFKRRFFNEEDILEDYSQYNKNDIIIITPVYNAEEYISNNILSVASQMYDSYRHIIIDDMSTDNTYQVAKETIESLPFELRNGFTLIKSNEKRYALGNQIHALKHIKGNPIIVLLDGDDWLKNDPYIFEFINREYERGAKFTYGSFHAITDNMNCIAQPYPEYVHYKKIYRDYKFPWGMPYTHLRTFRKELFDNVDDSEFKDDEGNYFRAGGDNALFYPLIEQCDISEIRAIQKILVMYNDGNPLNDFKVNKENQLYTAFKVWGKNSKQVHGTSYDDYKIQIKEYFSAKSRYMEKNFSILDVGAGAGTYSKLLRDISSRIDAVEVYEPNIIKNKLNELYDNVYNQDIIDFKFEGNYDIIIMGDVIEHIETEKAIKLVDDLYDKCDEMLIAVPFMLEQEAIYGNEYEKHLQSDLTDEVFKKRYPGFKNLFINEKYGYYIKDREHYKTETGENSMNKKDEDNSQFKEPLKNRIIAEKNNKNLLAIDLEKLEEIRKNKDPELLADFKEVLIEREDVWVDDINASFIKVRVDWLKSKLNSFNRSSKILDLGSWTGSIANEISLMGFNNITCVDISKKVVEKGSKTFPHLNWIQSDVEELKLNEKFDIIIMMEILEHVVDAERLIDRLKLILNENGIIIFTIPSEKYVFQEGSYEHISILDKNRVSNFSDNVIVNTLRMSNPEYEWYAGIISSQVKENTHKRILIAIPTAKNIEVDTFKSIYYMDRPKDTTVDFQYFYGYRVDQVRNLIAHWSINNGYDYVLFLDADMILPKDTLTKLINFNGDIVSGIYIQRRMDKQVTEVHIDSGNVEDPAFFEGKDYVNVNSTGFGCVLVRTDILKHVGYPQFEYHPSLDFKDTLSEDADFCMKAKKLGYEVSIISDLRYGHIGSFKLELGKSPL